VESELVAAGSINGVINGKHYNRAIRTHKVMFEALTRLLFDMYMQSLPAESQEQISLFIGKNFSLALIFKISMIECLLITEFTI
jgi:hypothetical protein